MTFHGSATADLVRRLFADRARASHDEDSGDAAEQAQFRQTLELTGLPLMLVPEAAGGSGLGEMELLDVARASGYFDVDLPLVECMVAGALLATESGVALHGRMGLSIEGCAGRWTLRVADGIARLSGTDDSVPWGCQMNGLLCVGADFICALDTTDVRWTSHVNLAGDPRDGAVVSSIQVTPMKSFAHRKALNWMALARAGQCLGALDKVLDLSLAHVKNRIQFGKPLSRIQAVQQQMAEMASEVAAAVTITNAAAKALAADRGELLLCASRIRVADAIDRCVDVAHQVHGAIGFSREYELNRFTRRLLAWRDEYGSSYEWRKRMGKAFAGTKADGLWAKLPELGIAPGSLG